MVLKIFLIIFSLCFGINSGQEFNNSTVVIRFDDNFGNATNLDNNSLITRIVGGQPLNIVQVPYQVALYVNGRFSCGGSIISADWILTAAHCVVGGGDFAVRAGSRYILEGGQIRHAKLAVYNSGYSPKTMQHDIALIRVKEPFKWSRRVKPVQLAKPRWKLPQQYLVSGWGTVSEYENRPSYALRGAIVNKVSRKKCRAQYKKQNIRITKTMICAGGYGKDACQGDSGGPLTYKGVQYGIVSYGIGCARPNYSGVYSNVRWEYRFIKKAIKRFGGKMPKIFEYIV